MEPKLTREQLVRGVTLRNEDHDSTLVILQVDEERALLWSSLGYTIPTPLVYLTIGNYTLVGITDEAELVEIESRFQSYLD